MILKSFRHRIRHFILISVAVVGGSVVTLAVVATLHPPTGRHVMAMAIGGRYLDDKGVLFQQSDEDCGVAALEMLYVTHRIDPNLLRQARELVIARDSGLTMLEMHDLATRHGLVTSGWRMTLADLRRARLPAIAVFPDHYVVLDRVTQGGYVEIRDPEIGRVRMTHRQFLDQWTGEVLLAGL